MPVPQIGIVDNDVEYLGSWFTIDITTPKGKPENPFFREASGLALEITVADFTENSMNGKTQTRKRPGVANFGDVTLKRVLSKDKTFWNWAKAIRDGENVNYRCDGAIVLHDITGKEIGRWTFTNAWPSKWSASDLDVGSDDPMMEEVTLAIEGLKREK